MMGATQKIVGFSSNSRVAHGNVIPTELASLSAWKAFQSGMQILQRYANRSPVDIQTIAKSNLRLLHRSLSYNAQYSNKLENIRRGSTKSGLPTLRRLFAEQGLTADLLALQDGASMNLVSLPQRSVMYLIISGSAQLTAENEKTDSAQHWWNRISTSSQKNRLCSGSVVICSNPQANRRLTARRKTCLIMRVHTPTIETPCQMAS